MRGYAPKTAINGSSRRNKIATPKVERGRLLRIFSCFVVVVGIAVVFTMIGTAFPPQPTNGPSRVCFGPGIAGHRLAAQELSSTAQPQGSTTSPDPPGTIDGAKNPELIPDEVAYRLIFLAVAEPPNANDAQKARAQAKISPAGLGEQDTASLLEILAGFRANQDLLDAQAEVIYQRSAVPHPDNTDFKLLTDLQRQRDQLVGATIAEVKAKISEEGMVMLQAFIQNEKRGMKILPDANSSLTQQY